MSSSSSVNALLSSSSAASSSSSINISSLLAAATGASSVGIDVTAAVDAAVYAAQAPERLWQAQQATLQSQMTAVTSIQTALGQMTTDLNALNDPLGALAATTVSSSNPSIVTATSAAGTTAGNHVLTVTSLATSSSWYSAPVASASASLGSSALTITQAGGTQTTFNLSSTSASSLTALAHSINAAGIGVNASVISDTSGVRLALVGQSTGAAANFTVSGTAAAATTFNSASLASGSSTLSPSSFQVGDGVTSASITVAAGATLSSVTAQINSQGLNLTASVVTDASGAHLSVTGNGGNAVSISADPALVLTQAKTAADASLTVDNIPITSSSNTVSNAVQGVTFNLQGVTAPNQVVNLDVTADSSQISTAISKFVTDYNSAATLVNSQFTYSSITGSQGLLGSDASIRSLQSTLLGLGSYTAPSSSSSAQSNGSFAPVSSLAGLGITMNNDGTLTLNSTKLDQVISSNPSGMQSFLQGTALNGFANTTQTNLALFDDPSSGVLQSDLKSMSQENTALQTSVSNYESGYIASQRTILTAMYSSAEIALQQLPTQLKQLQAQLGGSSSGG